MGDHIVLLVDCLVAESTHEAAIESKSMSNLGNEEMGTDVNAHRIDLSFESVPKKLVECRICHDEDEELNMEAPCACCGSLKYAHRKCVQRWCNAKGNTICEICQQPFKPDYTSQPPLLQCNAIPTNFRERSRQDLYNLRFSAMHYASHDEPDFDEYITLSSKSLICCRAVAIIFMILLVLRHTLPIIISGTRGYTATMLAFVMIRSIGVLLSMYLTVRAFSSVKRLQQAQDDEEENNLAESETHLHVVHVH